VLKDSEVDRRFLMLVADLNATAQPVDGPRVTEPAASESPDDKRRTSDDGIVALRVLAVGIALVTVVAGIMLARAVDLGILALLVWFALVVPGVTLAALMLVDWLRRSR
jgi:hypothetical protein